MINNQLIEKEGPYKWSKCQYWLLGAVLTIFIDILLGIRIYPAFPQHIFGNVCYLCTLDKAL